MNKRYAILITVLLSSLLFASTAYCAELTEREWQIFYDSFDGNHTKKEVQKKYSITADQQTKIVVKATMTALSKKEEKIVEDYRKKKAALPESATSKDKERLEKKFCKDNGISLGKLRTMEMRSAVTYLNRGK